MKVADLLESRAVGLSIILLITYTIYGAIWRLYFSPLARFPGPKLAGLTLWYEFYYDAIKGGKYYYKIKEMHKKYGPIVRISPGELHIEDSEYFDELLAGSSHRKSDRYAWVCKLFMAPHSLAGSVDHDEHRMRRAATAPFFSRRSVTQLEPYVDQYIKKLVRRLREYSGTGKPLRIEDAYAAMTADVITEYCYAQPLNHLDSEDFKDSLRGPMSQIVKVSVFTKQFGWLMPILFGMPYSWMQKLDSHLASILRIRFDLIDKMEEMLRLGRDSDKTEHKTILHTVLFESDLPDHERVPAKLSEAAHEVIGAGTITTAMILWTATFHLLNEPALLRRLRADLEESAETNPNPKWQDLEKLPLLTAIIKECLRWSYSVTNRTQRVFHEDIKYKNWIIPAGVPVGMTIGNILEDPNIFPEPRKFKPERWLVPKEKRPDKYLVSFSKGSRSCAGTNLAWCELYLCIAAVFGPGGVDMKLHETTVDDLEMVSEYIVAFPKEGSKGVWVTID